MLLGNENLVVEIADKGAEVTRIYDKKNSTEVLWNGDPKFWGRRSPVLFPNVGKTYQNKMLINGQIYQTSQHGFARDAVFSVVSSSDTEVVYVVKSDSETKKKYPFDYELYISYKLNANELQVNWEVKNPSDETMYFTIGGHPGFHFAEEGETKEDYCLWFPKKEKLAPIKIDMETGTGRPDTKYDLVLEDGYYPLNDELFANDALVFDGDQFDEVWICHKDKTPYVGMKCPGFYSFGIWSLAEAPFVCLEPWAGRCDNYGFDKEISEKDGINKVEAGTKFEKSYTIVVGK